MQKVKQFALFMLSLLVIAVSVVILLLVSCLSMLFNGIMFIFMVTGLGVPMAGNMLAGKFLQK